MYIFYKAKVIISAHGAGLVNILFCNKNTTIIEISTIKQSKLLHFQDIAVTLGLKNYKRYTNVSELTINSYESDMNIENIPAFLSFLNSVIAN